MGLRGPKPASAFLVPDNPSQIQRPDAPYDLADDEAAEWRAIISAMPPDHFDRSNHPLLAQLCRHIISARRVAMLIAQCVKARPFDRQNYASLLQLQNAETMSIMRLSRSMRLTQQAVYRADAKREPVIIDAPWERG